jgi:membrane protein implicated in regulation of membrane protease activity
MDLIGLIGSLGAWAWFVAGAVLLALELVLPGGIFLWLGIAGLITGLASLVQPIGWPLQFLIFGLLSLVSVFAWLSYSRNRQQATDRPFLNRRAERFIGQEVVLDEPILDGQGRVALGDTTWRVVGPDLAAGSKVRIVDAEGAVLKVEAA